MSKSTSTEALVSPKSKLSPYSLNDIKQNDSQDSNINVTSRFNEASQNGSETTQRDTKTKLAKKTESKQREKTQITDNGRDSVSDSGMGSVSKRKKLPPVHFSYPCMKQKLCILSA